MTDTPPFKRTTRLLRRVELGPQRLQMYDWPGGRGPLVCLACPTQSGTLFDALGESLAPEWRVIELDPRRPGGSHGYQVATTDTVSLLDQFGFQDVVLVGLGYGALIALLVAAWHPAHVQALVMLDGGTEVRDTELSALSEGEARAYRDGPPDYARLHASVRCPTLVVRTGFSGAASGRALAAADEPYARMLQRIANVRAVEVTDARRPATTQGLPDATIEALRTFLEKLPKENRDSPPPFGKLWM